MDIRGQEHDDDNFLSQVRTVFHKLYEYVTVIAKG